MDIDSFELPHVGVKNEISSIIVPTAIYIP